jgi:hypothetical protein
MGCLDPTGDLLTPSTDQPLLPHVVTSESGGDGREVSEKARQLRHSHQQRRQAIESQLAAAKQRLTDLRSCNKVASITLPLYFRKRFNGGESIDAAMMSDKRTLYQTFPSFCRFRPFVRRAGALTLVCRVEPGIGVTDSMRTSSRRSDSTVVTLCAARLAVLIAKV